VDTVSISCFNFWRQICTCRFDSLYYF